MNYNSISIGYERQTYDAWDSFNAPTIDCCDTCKGYIPSALATYAEIKDDVVFCSTFCLEEWIEEFGWEYED